MRSLLPLLAAEAVGETAQNAGMDMTSMANTLDMLLSAMLLIAPFYCFFTFFRVRKECMLIPNKILYPGNCPPDACLNDGAFMDYMLPRVLILGILLLICGIAYTLLVLVMKINTTLIGIASMVVPVAILAWYVVCQRKAAKLYW